METLLYGALFMQSSIYQIYKRDILVADPTPGAPVGALANIAEARARGFEDDVVGDLSTAWTLAFNYAYNDTKILEGDDEIRNAVGNRFANAPRHQLGFWTRYDIDVINSALTFGGDYVAKRLSLSGQRRLANAMGQYPTSGQCPQSVRQGLCRKRLHCPDRPFPGRTPHLPGGSHLRFLTCWGLLH